MKRTILGLTIVVALVFVMVGSALADNLGKVYVCKYVGDPGSEVLQTGQNPIEVSVNSIKDFAGVGSWFNDEQGPSFVLGDVPMDPAPTAADCPQPTPPPPGACTSVGEWTFVSETDWVYDDVNHTRTKVQTFDKYDLNTPYGVCDTKTEDVTESATLYCIGNADTWLWPDENVPSGATLGACVPPPPVMCEWNDQILATDPLCVAPPPPPPPPGPVPTPVSPPVTGGAGGPP